MKKPTHTLKKFCSPPDPAEQVSPYSEVLWRGSCSWFDLWFKWPGFKSKHNNQKMRQPQEQKPTHISRFSMKLRPLLCHSFNFKSVQNKKRSPLWERQRETVSPVAVTVVFPWFLALYISCPWLSMRHSLYFLSPISSPRTALLFSRLECVSFTLNQRSPN